MSEGAAAYLGVGYELAKGIPGPITSYFEFQSETVDPKYSRKPNPNINPRKAQQKGRLVAVDIKGNIKAAPDAESQARMRAHHQGKVVTTNPTAGVYQHVLSPLMPGDADPVIYRKTLSGIVYRDDSAPTMMMGGVVDQVQTVIKQRDYVEETHDLMFDRYTRMRQPIADVGNNVGFTGTFFVRGVRRDSGNLVDSLLPKVHTTGAANGTAKLKNKIGTAAAYDVTKLMTPIFNQWFDLIDENGDPIGADDNRNPVQGMFYTANPLTDVLTANDLWEIKPRIAVITPSYTAREVYDSAQVVMTIDGNSFVFHQATIKGVKPHVADTGIGSIYSQGSLDNGEWQWSVEADRNYIDSRFVDAVENGAVVTLVAQMTGAKIGATAYRDSKTYRFAAMQYDQAGTNVANANALQEKIVLTAHDNLTDPICVETHVNTIAVL